MGDKFSMIYKDDFLQMIEDRISEKNRFKDILLQEINTLSQNEDTDPITIQKINNQINDIDLAVEALRQEALTIG